MRRNPQQLPRDHWERVKSIVADAAEIESETERRVFLADSCGDDAELRNEVESLLHQTTTGFDERVEALTAIQSREQGFQPGTLIGAYAIERELGRGGMGAVYLAHRADGKFEKQVAIKLLKRGIDTDAVLARFAAESRILARFDHPNIARLLDAGTSADGLPYFVMEYVEGSPITDFSRERGLPIAERLKLFQVICDAVSEAHRNLVVHRDLKPSNVLVNKKGDVKLLDFGIAKLIQEADEAQQNATLTKLRVMTPEYASPEQLKGEPITTVSDVYSLGVLLYELLAGCRPYRLKTRAPDEIARAITTQEPERPSTAVKRTELNATGLSNQKRLRGDLDNVVLKALRKEPSRRYGSVPEFADDLRRYLGGLPVRARPDTPGYRVSKFLSRHKMGVAVATLAALLLIGATVAITVEWHRAQLERTKAEARFDILRKSSRTMISEIHGALMNLPGSIDARKLLLQRATEQLDALAADADDHRRLQMDLADAYQNIGYLPDKPLAERIELFQKAIALDQKVLAKDPANIAARENLAMSKVSLADFARVRGDMDKALNYNYEAISLLESVARDEPSEMEHKKTLWNASYNAGMTLMQLGRAAEVLQISRRIYKVAVELREKHTADNSDPRFRRPYLSLGLAANSLIYLGRYDEAIADLRTSLAAIAETQRRFPLGPYERLDETVFKYRLAMAFEDSGHREEAIETMKEAQSLAERLARDEPKNLAYQNNAALLTSQLGCLLLRAHKSAESIDSLHSAIDLYNNILIVDAEQLQARAGLAYVYAALGYAEAQSGHAIEGVGDKRKALSFYDTLDPAKTPDVRLLHDCADALEWAGETSMLDKTRDSTADAKQLFQRSLDIWQLMRDRGILAAADSKKAEEITAEINLL